MRGERVGPSTRFRYASVTKLFTADAILRMVRGGHIKLHESVVNYLDGVPAKPPSQVTIKQLLMHSAGFDRVRSLDAMFHINKKPWCPYELERLASRKLAYKPGEKQAYSNEGYCVLGAVIEQVSGSDYRTYIEDNYFKSGQSFRFVDGEYLPDEVDYDFRFAGFYGKGYQGYFDFEALSAVAGLSGSAKDLAEVVRRMIQSEAPGLRSAPVEPECRVDQHYQCYGYAFYRYQPGENRMPVFIHGGALPGSSAAVVADSEGGVFVWLGAGEPPDGTHGKRRFYDYVYKRLESFYR